MEEQAMDREAMEMDRGRDRAGREIREFQSRYPDVTLTRQVLQELAADVVGENPMTLTQAYQKWQVAQKEREIAELKTRLAAQQQNRENRAASPSAQTDSGAPRPAGALEEFLAGYTG